MVTFKWYFGHEWHFSILVFRSFSNDRNGPSDQASIGYLKPNRDCSSRPPLHRGSQPHLSWRPPTHHIGVELRNTRRLNLNVGCQNGSNVSFKSIIWENKFYDGTDFIHWNDNVMMPKFCQNGKFWTRRVFLRYYDILFQFSYPNIGNTK